MKHINRLLIGVLCTIVYASVLAFCILTVDQVFKHRQVLLAPAVIAFIYILGCYAEKLYKETK